MGTREHESRAKRTGEGPRSSSPSLATWLCRPLLPLCALSLSLPLLLLPLALARFLWLSATSSPMSLRLTRSLTLALWIALTPPLWSLPLSPAPVPPSCPSKVLTFVASPPLPPRGSLPPLLPRTPTSGWAPDEGQNITTMPSPACLIEHKTTAGPACQHPHLLGSQFIHSRHRRTIRSWTRGRVAFEEHSHDTRAYTGVKTAI